MKDISIPKGTTKGATGSVHWTLPNKKKVLFSSTQAESHVIAMFKKECTSYDELIQKLRYAPVERNIVRFYQNNGVKFEDWHVR